MNGCSLAAQVKHGGSLGLCAALSLVGLAADLPSDPQVAMTGELDLRGNLGSVAGLEVSAEGRQGVYKQVEAFFGISACHTTDDALVNRASCAPARRAVCGCYWCRRPCARHWTCTGERIGWEGVRQRELDHSGRCTVVNGRDLPPDLREYGATAVVGCSSIAEAIQHAIPGVCVGGEAHEAAAGAAQTAA